MNLQLRTLHKHRRASKTSHEAGLSLSALALLELGISVTDGIFVRGIVGLDIAGIEMRLGYGFATAKAYSRGNHYKECGEMR